MLAATVRLATPILLTSLGEIFAERSGVLNLGMEGMMLIGAFTSFTVAYFTGDLFLGLLMGIASGALLGLVMGIMCITSRADQVVAGIILTVFCQGLVGFLRGTIYGRTYIPLKLHFGALDIPVLSKIPIIGPILFQQNIFVYFALISTPLLWFVLFHTTIGLTIRGVGENPKAADTLGINVSLVRYGAITFGGAMAGLGGTALSLGFVPIFDEGIISGRGWISLAIVVFSMWDPLLALFGSLLFGGVDALQLKLQIAGVQLPTNFLLMLPYILTIVVVFLVAKRKVSAPASLTVPYEREK